MKAAVELNVCTENNAFIIRQCNEFGTIFTRFASFSSCAIRIVNVRIQHKLNRTTESHLITIYCHFGTVQTLIKCQRVHHSCTNRRRTHARAHIPNDTKGLLRSQETIPNRRKHMPQMK